MEKEEYCRKCVEKTFEIIATVRDIANAHLIKDNGTWFLKMAYEEVLWPVMFFMKKMYAGIAHVEKINFHPRVDELFVKGLSMGKRGTSDVLRKTCEKLLMVCLDIKNTTDVRPLVEKAFRDIYTTDWDLADFKRTAMLKPVKKAVTSVHTFYDRMVKLNDPMHPPPKYGERFEYVVAKKYPWKYNIKGNKTALLKGEKWEFYSYAKENKLEVDMDEYLEGEVIGQFAQYLTYHPEFRATPTDSTEEAYEIAEKKTLAYANVYMKNMQKILSGKPVCKGPILKSLYRIAKKNYTQGIESACGGYKLDTGVKKMLMTATDTGAFDMFERLKDIVVKEGHKSALEYGHAFMDNVIKRDRKSRIIPTGMDKKQTRRFTKNHDNKIICKVLSVYDRTNTSLLKYRERWRAEEECRLMATISEYAPKFVDMFAHRDATIMKEIKGLENTLNVELDTITDEKDMPDHKKFAKDAKMAKVVDANAGVIVEELKNAVADIDILRDIYDRLKAVTEYVEKTKGIIECASFMIDDATGGVAVPPEMKHHNPHAGVMEYVNLHLISF